MNHTAASTPTIVCSSLLNLLMALLILVPWPTSAAGQPGKRPPNIVLIFCDDLGWGDLGCYGARNIRTPTLDQLARQGTRFTDFYVAQAVCSASRAALLTGCYPNRLGIHGALFPAARHGLHTNETTIASMLKARGYTTAIYGKWHLGRPEAVLPTRHGFDEYMGLPYSNDMWPHHPTAKSGAFPPLPLIEGDRVVETNPDQSLLTQRYTDRAVRFIEQNAHRPFFLYLAHSMPHVPLFAGATFKGRSGAGLYPDVIEEIDHSVGRVLEALDRLDLSRDTWVIFTSDNGPWHFYGDHAGSAAHLREGKGSTFEGGVRVPCIMRWPGQIPASRVSKTPWMTIDLLPSIAQVTGSPLPSLPIDGRSAWSVISGKPGARSPQPAYFFYYEVGELQAIRSDRWKLHFPHTANALNGRPGGIEGKPVPVQRLKVGLELYDLKNDPGERRNLAQSHPRTVKRLESLAERARAELGDSLQKRVGSGIRPPLTVTP